ncbi:MAG: glycerate kinase [Chloroflexi bacterium]|nr:glycerate kinase [Chloroflexota bacterium]
MTRRVLVCPQEFKGTLTAPRAAEVIAAAVRAVLPDAEVIERPMADGGPGTSEIIGRAPHATVQVARVVDAYGALIEASYALLDDGATAVIDSAAAVSLAATALDRRDPLSSTSRGVGMLIQAAVAAGATRIILGVGGTASSDGGAGLARALGIRPLDATGHEFPEAAAHLVKIAGVEDHVSEAFRAVEVRVAVDVRNPLTGPEGAAAVYGAQKGLLDWQAPALDAALVAWARRVRADLGREIEAVEGAGAGGGIPAGVLAALPDATIESGAALVAEAIGLREEIAAADLVITGEGSLDGQTAFGKAVGHVAALASEAGTRCVAVAGVVEATPPGIQDAEPLALTRDEVDASLEAPERFLAEATTRLLGRWDASTRA